MDDYYSTDIPSYTIEKNAGILRTMDINLDRDGLLLRYCQIISTEKKSPQILQASRFERSSTIFFSHFETLVQQQPSPSNMLIDEDMITLTKDVKQYLREYGEFWKVKRTERMKSTPTIQGSAQGYRKMMAPNNIRAKQRQRLDPTEESSESKRTNVLKAATVIQNCLGAYATTSKNCGTISRQLANGLEANGVGTPDEREMLRKEVKQDIQEMVRIGTELTRCAELAIGIYTTFCCFGRHTDPFEGYHWLNFPLGSL
ncbi:MAG: hypothetical protein J3Q66DRAFT_399634 [Benniella sp.]|nr:MAG: hypothetical protein J3Q66DRAFT_399634 [Benniella sp.]